MVSQGGSPSRLDATTDAERAQRLKAIGLMCIALMCFSTLDTTAKYLTASFPVIQIIFCRYLSHVFAAIGTTPPKDLPHVWRTRRWVLQILRGLFMLGATSFNFIAVQYLQLAETMSIFFATPLMVALLSGPLLNEWVGPRRLVAICVGFTGVLLVVRPGLGGLPWQAIFSVLAMLSYSGYAITTRMLAPTEKSTTAQFYSATIGTLAFLPLVIGVWQTPTSLFLAFLLLATGFIGFTGHQFMIAAHRIAPAAILSPFIYTQIFWMSLLGYLIFGDIPGIWTIAGASVVIASGLYLLWRERVVKEA
ncbi:MAG: DMT family transporter [Rhodobiaceae bacterium]|nr:DMT family transporter [Rhodobiaceae bacterium]MCC0014392.1 DMT family transporter [Rhodobiaceae bacterium]MCC0050974.1 DMT family transporter [Rhodobiaceae bacterium]MCC0060334.1 DMT family transporter [Rhodobiaceae bacterium]